VLTRGGERTGGGRWKLHSGEPAARFGQEASVEALWVQEEGRSGTCWRCKRPEGGVHYGDSYGGQRLVTRTKARGGELDSIYSCSCLGEGVTVWRKDGARRDGQW
jgi:hypothetical protein